MPSQSQLWFTKKQRLKLVHGGNKGDVWMGPDLWQEIYFASTDKTSVPTSCRSSLNDWLLSLTSSCLPRDTVCLTSSPYIGYRLVLVFVHLFLWGNSTEPSITTIRCTPSMCLVRGKTEWAQVTAQDMELVPEINHWHYRRVVTEAREEWRLASLQSMAVLRDTHFAIHRLFPDKFYVHAMHVCACKVYKHMEPKSQHGYFILHLIFSNVFSHWTWNSMIWQNKLTSMQALESPQH